MLENSIKVDLKNYEMKIKIMTIEKKFESCSKAFIRKPIQSMLKM